VIEVQGLSKSFGDVHALEDVSFTAADGHIVGLIGPNGAGKSTCLRILSTVLTPDRGTARVGGVDLAADPLAARRLIGALPHSSGLYPQLTARENIEYYGKLHGIPAPALAARVDTLIERLDLRAIADRKTKGFSQGERTKTALARALVHDPQHLLLDEPTAGLDVMATRHLRHWLRELRAQGRCVLLSSHVMQEVEALVDDLVIIGAGRVALRGTPAELRERFPNRDLEEIFVDAVGGAAAAAASTAAAAAR
jgi:sodium transport system ATP-binding protein